MSDGILAYQQLRMAADCGWVTVIGHGTRSTDIWTLTEAQFQPASLDLRLGPVAYRVMSSFLPGPRSVAEILEDMVMYQVPLESGAILERGHVYVIPLLESLALPPEYWGRTNPKSSIGRLDIFTRILADHAGRFDEVPLGYRGSLYLEVFSRSFTFRVRTGESFAQLRLCQGNPHVSSRELLALCLQHKGLLRDDHGDAIGIIPGPLQQGLALSIDLSRTVPGYKARHHTDIIDLQRLGAYNPALFWEPIVHNDYARRPLILEPEEFYLFTSRERVEIPSGVAGELVAYDPGAGEVRTHYAGFFDPGFGVHTHEPLGAQVVFEVRPHDVPFLLEDGQDFGTLCFDRMLEVPHVLYGEKVLGSHYGTDRIFSKYFGPWTESE